MKALSLLQTQQISAGTSLAPSKERIHCEFWISIDDYSPQMDAPSHLDAMMVLICTFEEMEAVPTWLVQDPLTLV